MKLRVIVDIEQNPEHPGQNKVEIGAFYLDRSGDTSDVGNPPLVIAALEQAKLAMLTQVAFHPPARILKAVGTLPPMPNGR